MNMIMSISKIEAFIPQISPIRWWLVFLLLLLFIINTINVMPTFNLNLQTKTFTKKKEKSIKW